MPVLLRVSQVFSVSLRNWTCKDVEDLCRVQLHYIGSNVTLSLHLCATIKPISPKLREGLKDNNSPGLYLLNLVFTKLFALVCIDKNTSFHCTAVTKEPKTMATVSIKAATDTVCTHYPAWEPLNGCWRLLPPIQDTSLGLNPVHVI